MDLRVVGLVPREPVLVRPSADGGPSIVLSLETGVARATIGDRSFAIDRTGLLVVPARRRALFDTRVPGTRACSLSIDEALIVATWKRYKKLGFDRKKLDRWLAELSLLPRTVWVHEIVHRYVFEREALNEHDNLATRFLEIEIVKELYFLFRDREEDGLDRANIAQRHSTHVEKAIAWIEAHLFESKSGGAAAGAGHALSMKTLSRHAGASESTLLRSFRRELGISPSEYWRTRRLDEAMILLRSGRYTIAELATRTGYDNPSSFTFAFQKRFGNAPTHFIERRPTKRAP